MKAAWLLGALAAVALTIPSVLHGQTEVSVGLIGGASQYDLSGTGTTGFAGLRLDVVPESARFIVLEAALEHFGYETQFGENETLWFPEAAVQLQIPGRVLRPYLGIGAGYAFSTYSAPTLFALGGTRVRIASRWTLQAELRVRAVDPWGGSTADWGLGVSRRF